MQQKSFYQYLMTYRNAVSTNQIEKFANDAALDLEFPKQSKDYHEITQYLELNANYLMEMSIFDELWQEYRES